MDKPSIESVLRHYGADRVPTAHRWRPMLCVLHDERNPSASVNTEENKFRCFVCDFNGDSFDLIAEKEGFTDFISTCEFAERVFANEFTNVPAGGKGVTRRRVPFDSGPVSGQRDIFSPRVRRVPLAGA